MYTLYITIPTVITIPGFNEQRYLTLNGIQTKGLLLNQTTKMLVLKDNTCVKMTIFVSNNNIGIAHIFHLPQLILTQKDNNGDLNILKEISSDPNNCKNFQNIQKKAIFGAPKS